jgi:diadenosine tetraphosphate (Ap4A) HIT family hydrolase
MGSVHRGFRTSPCFVCRMAEGDEALVFLDGYPRANGYTLVVPKEHREQLTADFAPEDFLRLQSLVYKVAEAVREEVGAERMYRYTLGCSQGKAHVHWHVVPLPPGVPYEDQKGAWAGWDGGVPEIPPGEMRSLARRVGRRL